MDGWMSGYMDGRMDGSATLKTLKRPRLLDYDCREKRPGGRDSALDRRSGRPAPRAPLTELRGLEKTPPPTGAHAPPLLSGVAFARPTFTASRTATSERQNSTRGHAQTLASSSPKINYQTVQIDKTTISTLWNASKSSRELRSACAALRRERWGATARGRGCPHARSQLGRPGGPAAAVPHGKGSHTVWNGG